MLSSEYRSEEALQLSMLLYVVHRNFQNICHCDKWYKREVQDDEYDDDDDDDEEE